jgi:hypothetical protein
LEDGQLRETYFLDMIAVDGDVLEGDGKRMFW